MRLAVLGALALLIGMGLVPSGSSGEEDVEVGRYIGGGSAMGTYRVCVVHVPSFLGEDPNHDIGGVCDLRCPGGTCDIEVLDDVRENDILFRVCFDGEEFCRPNVYHGFATVPGTKVTVVPSALSATHGTVFVR